MAVKDLTGQKFGKLTVLERADDIVYANGNKTIRWLCQCDCGNTVVVRSGDLKNGSTKSCGCLKHKQSEKLEDLTGQRFGRLTVIERAENSAKGSIRWLCQCDCGNQKIVHAASLKGGLTVSCGCYNNERRIESHTKHGHCHSRLYSTWCSIKDRCLNPNVPCYSRYGGRGITICDEWKNDFETFYEWAMDNGYDETKSVSEQSIDRIDVNGNYEPSNCRWADAYTQANNKRNNVRITVNGETHTIPEWSRLTGIKDATIRERMKLGWPTEDLLNPVRV